MLKPSDIFFGLSEVIFLSSGDVSPPDGALTGIDVMMTSYCNHDIISCRLHFFLVLKWFQVNTP